MGHGKNRFADKICQQMLHTSTLPTVTHRIPVGAATGGGDDDDDVMFIEVIITGFIRCRVVVNRMLDRKMRD